MPVPPARRGTACYSCDLDGDGCNDSCRICDTDGDGTPDACYECDTDGDGTVDACKLCDTDGDGEADSCFTTDTDGDGRPDGCEVCDNDGNGTKEGGFVCGKDGRGKPNACYQCDSDGDGFKDRCFDCDATPLNGDATFDSCKCDTDNDGTLDTCASCTSDPALGTSSSTELDFSENLNDPVDRIVSIAKRIPYVRVTKTSTAKLVLKGSTKFICCEPCDEELSNEIELNGTGSIGLSATAQIPFYPLPQFTGFYGPFAVTIEQNLGLEITGSGQVSGTGSYKKRLPDPCTGSCTKVEVNGSLGIQLFLGYNGKFSVRQKVVPKEPKGVPWNVIAEVTAKAGAQVSTGIKAQVLVQVGEKNL